MNKISIIGYPRIGENRELKKITESYFAGTITKKELISSAKKIRGNDWLIQKNKGIEYIPSNDFSFYDNMLDTAYMLNVIPSRYANLNLDAMDTYFAMAKGYQKNKKDVKALDMKKWFNTNYHYVVPEIETDTIFKLNSNKIFEEYQEALKIGIETKPVIIGPFTFLKLCKTKKGYSDYIDEIVKIYSEILDGLNNLNVKILQIDEPELVRDLTKDDISNFILMYKKILSQKKGLKILLQTYFGDIRDIYSDIISLSFDAIGIDFVEGKMSLELIQNNGFPNDKILFAGIVNGKNVWRNDYRKTIQTLAQIFEKVPKKNVVLSTSCSLLFAPYSLKYENKMEEKYKKHLAFAEEKTGELSELAELVNQTDYIKDERFIKNQNIINEKSLFADTDIREKVKNLKDKDFDREMKFEDRIKIQKNLLRLPSLPTTTIGSFPQTKEVRQLRNKYRKGEINGNEYKEKIKEKIKEVIKLQEEIGLDVLVHGEFERNDMVEYFGENLKGFLFTENGWVQSYGTRGVKPPIIFTDVKHDKIITVEWIIYSQGLTNKPVKGMLTGPITILNWSFPREDIHPKEIAYQIAIAIKEEVADLEKAGVKIIQIDEAALREKLPLRKCDWHKDYLDWAIKAFKLTHSSVKPETQIHTHMCYSEFADIINEISEMDADV
ncbi:MAG: 5-methyltetrahydropteroyltriglutamate--homocysteine S-methyltransferase, partial [Firmicutes bacterium HGW-Firmicutes-18]